MALTLGFKVTASNDGRSSCAPCSGVNLSRTLRLIGADGREKGCR